MKVLDVRMFTVILTFIITNLLFGECEILEAILCIISMTLAYILLVLCRIKKVLENNKWDWRL